MAIQLPFQNYTHVIINHLCLVSVKLSSIHEQTDFEFYNPTLEDSFSPLVFLTCIYIRLVSHQGKRNPRGKRPGGVACFSFALTCRVFAQCAYTQSREEREDEREIFGIIFLRFSIVAVLPGRVKGGKRTKLNSFSRNSRLARNGTIFSLRFTFIRRNGRELDDTKFSMSRKRKSGSAHSGRAREKLFPFSSKSL